MAQRDKLGVSYNQSAKIIKNLPQLLVLSQCPAIKVPKLLSIRKEKVPGIPGKFGFPEENDQQYCAFILLFNL